MKIEEKQSVQKRVTEFIQSKTPGEIFQYNDFNLSRNEFIALSKALSRLTKNGTIKRLRKGLYYKPKKTIFGELRPSEEEMIKALTQNNKKVTGYKTGVSEFNRLGLTTQVPRGIMIKAKGSKRKARIGNLDVNYKVLSQNIQLKDIDELQILDALKSIKSIPDTKIENTIIRLSSIINNMKLKDKYRLLFLSRKYNAQTRALLGAIFEFNKDIELSNKINKTLNPLSKYKIQISDKILPNKKSWGIK